MSKPRSCPFCSGDNIGIIPADIILGMQYWKIHCYDCGCTQTPVSNKEDAIENWNKRPNPWHTGLPTQYGEYVCLVHSMKCPHVKHKTIMEWGEHCAERQDWFNREGGCDYEVIAWFLLPPCPYGKEWDIKSPLANLKRKERSRSK